MVEGIAIVQKNNNGHLLVKPISMSGRVILPGHSFPSAAAIAETECPMTSVEELVTVGMDPDEHFDEIDAVNFTAKELLTPDMQNVGLILMSIAGETCRKCSLSKNCRIYQNSQE